MTSDSFKTTENGVEDLLNTLRQFDALRDLKTEEQAEGDTVQTRMLERIPPQFAPDNYLEGLPSAIRKALARMNISRLYSHQAEAIEYIRSGKDVVLESPTASGKTLCFNIPLVDTLLKDPQAHALMIHPMKALSQDQRRQFNELAEALVTEGERPLGSWVFDGDLEDEYRKLLKKCPPAVLFTNPEMLHASFLGGEEQWSSFLSKLKIVILDEIHEYRGFFGTNVALLLRRFFAKLGQMSVRPQLVLATATCGNAEEHALRLTGRQCALVKSTTALRPERHLVFVNPNIPNHRFYDIYRLRIKRAALACVSQGLNTLIFCPSRTFAEKVAIEAKREAEKYNIDPKTIVPYRSGYSAEDRREIEDGMRDGSYKAVFSTNALEIGIDIGRLDVCILAGFPDSVFSAWQRIGRVGRRWDKRAYVLFYAWNNPFDQFFANNIDAFLNKPLDEILIGTDNEELMYKHLPYLLHECGGEPQAELIDHLGQPFFDYARKSLNGKKPFVTHPPKYSRLSLRGASGITYQLKYKGKEIGEISDTHLFREAYLGAIYNHLGKSYEVTTHGTHEVCLEDADPDLHTEGIFWTQVTVDEVLDGFRFSENLAVYYGKLAVFENFGGFKLINTYSGEVINEDRNPSTPNRTLNVRGFWLGISDASKFLNGESVDNILQDLFGVEQLFRIGAPFIIPCDRHDLCTFTNNKTLPTVYLYETVPGGIGVTEKALKVWPRILRTAIRIVEKCDCRDGCPRCLVPSRLPPGFFPPQKDRTIQISRKLLDLYSSSSYEKFDPDSHAWVLVKSSVELPG
ncbi:MAG: hypothetical protein KatS3mg104_2044 [Phycisphaerae bacterium]|jgi:DEAD/DEAH box helicase domain-containing protein|nr:MAG: hypothetical protein KatS3mg104_2044 [Phycisphaerae bacterium]